MKKIDAELKFELYQLSGSINSDPSSGLEFTLGVNCQNCPEFTPNVNLNETTKLNIVKVRD